jgi:hypothetical protein
MGTRGYNSYVLAVVFVCHISYFYTSEGCLCGDSEYGTNKGRRPFYSQDKRMILRSLLYIIAVMLIIGWAVGYFIWRPGPLIHIMALFAAASFVLALSRKEGIR